MLKLSVFVGAIWAIALLKKCDADYVALFTRPLQDCKDFKNEAVNVSLRVQDADGLCIAGVIDVLADTDPNMEVHLDVNKVESDGSTNPLITAVLPLKESIKDTDAPWSGLVKAMGLEDVPIPIKTYDIADVEINMDSAQPFLTEENEGCYEYKFSLEFGRDQVACYQGELAIAQA